MHIKTYMFSPAKLLMLLLTITFNGKVIAQSITDTVFQVPAVVISAPRNEHFRNDIKTEEFTRNELSAYAGESLTRFLATRTALNIKTYGVGGAASSVVLRGTAASHVQVNWNGFPINSVTLGSYDFSMLPAGGFDRVSVVYGASGALYGSGTFGGAVSLNNDSQIEKALNGTVQLGYQSLKTLTGGASFYAGNNNLAWKIHTWGAVSANEFNYYDYIRRSQRKQTDGDWNDAGMVQHLALKLSSSSTLEAGLWYQIKSYNIPSRIGSTSYEFQKDSTLKLYLGYKKLGKRWSLKVKAAMFKDDQNYRLKASAESPVNSIESNIASVQYCSDANFRYYLRPWVSFDAGMTGTYITADVSAYGKRKDEKDLAAFAGIKYDHNSLVLLATVRKEWSSTFQSGILPSFGLAWDVLPGKLKLRANISQKFRKPTFNDLYWMPGGNSNLKPESGYSVETGSEIILLKKENFEISADISLYRLQVKDMILWRPAGAYWMAVNYQQVISAGIDAGLIFDLQKEHWKYSSSLKLTLNRSSAKPNEGDIKEKMLYAPHIIASWENTFSAGIFDFTLWNHFTSARHYDEVHLLDPFYKIDIQSGANIPAGPGKLGVHVVCNNLTNTNYELIRLYPMPGRYWSLRLNYAF